MKLDNKRFEKIVLNNGEKDYIFYIGSTTNDFFNKANEIILLVDSEDNVLNVWHGRRPQLYKNILYMDCSIDTEAYFDINTGEQLFKTFTDNHRLCSEFKYGYARMYNDNIRQYEIFNTKGEIIKAFNWFYMISENRGIVEDNRTIFNNATLVDKDLNYIKEHCFHEQPEYDDLGKYILAEEGINARREKYYLFDYNGNKVSEGYHILKTDDFKTFKVKDKAGEDYKILTIDDILI